MSSLPPIVHARPGEARMIAHLISDAFKDLPPARWLVPDPAQRRTVLAAQFKILVEHAFEFGDVYVLEDRSAVAVWFHRYGDIPEPRHYTERLAAACGEHTQRFQLLDKLFDTNHPDGRHEHLAFLAVHPAAQHTGRGSALLQHHHAHLDSLHLPAYLEASSPRSRDLYARHGYLQGTPFHLPDKSAFWPMTRPGAGSDIVPGAARGGGQG